MLEAKDVAIKNQGEDSCFTLEAPCLLFPGRGLFLLGDSGSGKTTLLEALQGLRPLARGKILAEGEEKTSFNPSETTYCPAGGPCRPFPFRQGQSPPRYRGYGGRGKNPQGTPFP